VINWCKAEGLKTILIADVDPPEEDYDGPRPKGVDEVYERGELTLEQILELVGTSLFTVGPVGFICPMSIALGNRCLVLHGGGGGFSGPGMIDAPGRGRLEHFLPVNFCTCFSYHHNCDKSYSRSLLYEKLKKVSNLDLV
jgi:hypothetical protein